jgi:hypothetical protein
MCSGPWRVIAEVMLAAKGGGHVGQVFDNLRGWPIVPANRRVAKGVGSEVTKCQPDALERERSTPSSHFYLRSTEMLTPNTYEAPVCQGTKEVRRKIKGLPLLGSRCGRSRLV